MSHGRPAVTHGPLTKGTAVPPAFGPPPSGAPVSRPLPTRRPPGRAGSSARGGKCVHALALVRPWARAAALCRTAPGWREPAGLRACRMTGPADTGPRPTARPAHASARPRPPTARSARTPRPRPPAPAAGRPPVCRCRVVPCLLGFPAPVLASSARPATGW